MCIRDRVGWVCPTLGIILTQSASALVNVVYGPSSNFLLPSVHIYTKIWSPSLIHVRGWWGGQKNKNIDILTYKHGLLSIDMKTKVIQHVESEWMRDWKRVLQDIPGSQLFWHSDIFIITRTVKTMLMLTYTQNEAVFQNKRPTMHNSCWKT